MSNPEVNSLKERAKALKRIVIDSDEEFVLVIKKAGTIVTVCDAIISVQALDFQAGTRRSKLNLNVVNLNPIPFQATTVSYLPFIDE